MADNEEYLDLNDNENQEQINKAEKRFKDLSEKVRLTSEDRDELARAKETLEQEKVSLAKEVEFFKNFSQMASKYNGAGEYQDQIMEKVKAGYDVEDATISILAKEGKFNPIMEPKPLESPMGGSAPTQMRSSGDKPAGEMTQEERRNALINAEQEAGDITKIFQQRTL